MTRLEYLLALRRVKLPTPRCRPVLLALSTGDKRRQAATHSSTHLLHCPTCASLSDPLLRRRRPLAALLPLDFLSRPFSRHLRTPNGRVLALGTAGAAAATIITITLSNSPRPLQGPFVVQEQRLVARAVATHYEYAGEQVVARRVRVLSVPSDEGFWVR
jgi:hypothetical protein